MEMKNVKIKVRKDGCETTRCFIAESFDGFKELVHLVDIHFEGVEIKKIYYMG